MTPTATISRNRFVRHAFAFLLVALAGAFLFAFVPIASAQDPFGLQDTYGGIKQKGTFIRDPAVLIGNIVKIALALVGTIFFLLMLYAGFLWMTARGAQDTVKKAKDMISGAIIGLIIVSGAYAIANFVISGVSEPDVVLPTKVESDKDTIIDDGKSTLDAAGCESEAVSVLGNCNSGDPTSVNLCSVACQALKAAHPECGPSICTGNCVPISADGTPTNNDVCEGGAPSGGGGGGGGGAQCVNDAACTDATRIADCGESGACSDNKCLCP